MSEQISLKERIRVGEKVRIVRIPMSSTREQVLDFINETPCDMLYIDSQHAPHTEWDVNRIYIAAHSENVEEVPLGYCLAGLHISETEINPRPGSLLPVRQLHHAASSGHRHVTQAMQDKSRCSR
jgi:hypothetical protein